MKISGRMLLVLLIPLLAGCVGTVGTLDRSGGQTDVFGLTIGSRLDYHEINKVEATEEPCLRGYERSFDALNLSIGYGFDGKIRKITTRNAETSMFGIRPGMGFAAGKEQILKSGFRDYRPPYSFRADSYTLTFLVDQADRIFGLTLESLD